MEFWINLSSVDYLVVEAKKRLFVGFLILGFEWEEAEAKLEENGLKLPNPFLSQLRPNQILTGNSSESKKDKSKGKIHTECLCRCQLSGEL